jgi:serine/threonine-protein kinase
MKELIPRVGALLAGKYRLKRLIGGGSMGAVYEGTHVEIGKRVAVKLMNAEFMDSPDIVTRFRREARAASAVESDFIVQVFDAGKDDDFGVYMVTELLSGEDLESRIQREGRLDTATAVLIAYQAARGLAKAHGAGVVHRDLKPANVFLTFRDDDSLLVKILDFGISKVTHDDAAPRSTMDGNLTKVGMAIGTPQYMSPEQAQAMANVDARTDLWSLAAVLYEMLAGVPAFPETGTLFDVMLRIVRDDVPRLTGVAPWVPEAVAEVVHAALVRDRDKRIPDAATFAQRLLQAFPDIGGGMAGRMSLPGDVASPATIAAPPPARSRPDAVASEEPHATVDDMESPYHIDVELDSGPATLRDGAPLPPDPHPTMPAPPLSAESADDAPSDPPGYRPPSISPPSSANEDRVEVFQRISQELSLHPRDRDKP